jgi:hypothetical protein
MDDAMRLHYASRVGDVPTVSRLLAGGTDRGSAGRGIKGVV